MLKRQFGVDTEVLRVLVEVRLQVLPGGLGERGEVFGEKPHLLPHTPPYDRVVAVQAQGERFAVQDLLPDKLFHESVELGWRGWPLPRLLERVGQRRDPTRRDDDLVHRARGAVPAPPGMDSKQAPSQEQEMQQRFLEQAHGRPSCYRGSPGTC